MDDVIRHGRAAWDRIKKGSGVWEDWVLIGHALHRGRKIALHNSGGIVRKAAAIPTLLVVGW